MASTRRSTATSTARSTSARSPTPGRSGCAWTRAASASATVSSERASADAADRGVQVRRIVGDGEEETRDVILLPNRVVRSWWRLDRHRLVLEDLADVLDELPERLVVGTGADGRMTPDADVVERLRERGVEVEALPTGDAVRRYAELDPERTAAALPLTC